MDGCGPIAAERVRGDPALHDARGGQHDSHWARNTTFVQKLVPMN
jgi:hypothetical protein